MPPKKNSKAVNNPFRVTWCIKLKGFFSSRSHKTINKSEIVKLSELETGLTLKPS